MSDYTFNFAQGQATAEDLNRVTNNLNEDLANLESSVAKTIANWKSDAQEQYQQHKAKWDAAAVQMNEALVAAEQALGNIADNYQQTEQNAIKMWAN